MTYFKNFLYYLSQFLLLHSINVLLVIFIGILICIIYKQLTFKQKRSNYKIYNFGLNDLSIIIYIILFIMIILIIRYVRWGYSFDIKAFYIAIITFLMKMPWLIIINLMLIIIMFLLIWISFKNYLHKEIIKRHLYIYYTSYYETIKDFYDKNKTELPKGSDYSLYVQWSNKLGAYWSVKSVHDHIVNYCLIKPYCAIFNVDNYNGIKGIQNLFLFTLKYGSIMLLFLLVIYDCIYNQFKLHIVFYYLPFYFLYNIWNNISSFLQYTDKSLNLIIYERYYMEGIIYYLDITKEAEEFILHYLDKKCRCIIHDIPNNNFDLWWKKVNTINSFIQNISKRHKFVKENDSDLYKNHSTGEIISFANIKDLEETTTNIKIT